MHEREYRNIFIDINASTMCILLSTMQDNEADSSVLRWDLI